MVDRTKLYAVTRDRNGRRKWAVVGTLTPIKTGATEIYFEHTPTGAVGLESVYLRGWCRISRASIVRSSTTGGTDRRERKRVSFTFCRRRHNYG
jgi:hypothetical protein